jgi:hypothetical protein
MAKCELCQADGGFNGRCDEHKRCDGCGTRDAIVFRVRGVWCEACHRQNVEKEIADFDGDTEFEEECVCPWCGYQTQPDSDIRDGEDECGNCQRKFTMTRHYEVTYSTQRVY